MDKLATRQSQAAVVRSAGKPLVIEAVTLGGPRSNEVLVRVVACGVCHTDIVFRDQYYKSPLPIVLGFRLNHSQNATRVAKATADKKFLASLS
ncbi:Alcohol dehydrogenase GroES-like domain-containing protein [Mesorhizobium sp. YR577]|nr:Alcohol dehydrogenase GroES-like domain-containing protein [Mesorhizobium sp. YR577]